MSTPVPSPSDTGRPQPPPPLADARPRPRTGTSTSVPSITIPAAADTLRRPGRRLPPGRRIRGLLSFVPLTRPAGPASSSRSARPRAGSRPERDASPETVTPATRDGVAGVRWVDVGSAPGLDGRSVVDRDDVDVLVVAGTPLTKLGVLVFELGHPAPRGPPAAVAPTQEPGAEDAQRDRDRAEHGRADRHLDLGGRERTAEHREGHLVGSGRPVLDGEVDDQSGRREPQQDERDAHRSPPVSGEVSLPIGSLDHAPTHGPDERGAIA